MFTKLEVLRICKTIFIGLLFSVDLQSAITIEPYAQPESNNECEQIEALFAAVPSELFVLPEDIQDLNMPPSSTVRLQLDHNYGLIGQILTAARISKTNGGTGETHMIYDDEIEVGALQTAIFREQWFITHIQFLREINQDTKKKLMDRCRQLIIDYNAQQAKNKKLPWATLVIKPTAKIKKRLSDLGFIHHCTYLRHYYIYHHKSTIPVPRMLQHPVALKAPSWLKPHTYTPTICQCCDTGSPHDSIHTYSSTICQACDTGSSHDRGVVASPLHPMPQGSEMTSSLSRKPGNYYYISPDFDLPLPCMRVSMCHSLLGTSLKTGACKQISPPSSQDSSALDKSKQLTQQAIVPSWYKKHSWKLAGAGVVTIGLTALAVRHYRLFSR